MTEVHFNDRLPPDGREKSQEKNPFILAEDQNDCLYLDIFHTSDPSAYSVQLASHANPNFAYTNTTLVIVPNSV